MNLRNLLGGLRATICTWPQGSMQTVSKITTKGGKKDATL